MKLKGTRTRDFDRIGFTHLELSTILFNSILVINQKSNIKLSDYTITTGNSRSFQVLKNQAYYTVTELTKNLSDHLFINTKRARPELIQSELGIQLDLLVYKPNSNIYCLLSDQDKILTKTQCKLIIDAIQSELEYEDSQVLQTNISQTEIRSLFVTQDQLTLDPPEVVISGKFPFYSNLKQQKLIRNLRKILHLSSKLTNLFHSNLLKQTMGRFEECGMSGLITGKIYFTSQQIANCEILFTVNSRTRRDLALMKMSAINSEGSSSQATLINSNFNIIHENFKKLERQLYEIKGTSQGLNEEEKILAGELSREEHFLEALHFRKIVDRNIERWDEQTAELENLVQQDQEIFLRHFEQMLDIIGQLSAKTSVCFRSICTMAKFLELYTSDQAIFILVPSHSLEPMIFPRLNCRMNEKGEISKFHQQKIDTRNLEEGLIVSGQKLSYPCLKTGINCPNNFWNPATSSSQLIENNLFIRNAPTGEFLIQCRQPKVVVTLNSEIICGIQQKTIQLPFTYNHTRYGTIHSLIHILEITSHPPLSLQTSHITRRGFDQIRIYNLNEEISNILEQSWERITNTDELNTSHVSLISGFTLSLLLSSIIGLISCLIKCLTDNEKNKPTKILIENSNDSEEIFYSDSEEETNSSDSDKKTLSWVCCKRKQNEEYKMKTGSMRRQSFTRQRENNSDKKESLSFLPSRASARKIARNSILRYNQSMEEDPERNLILQDISRVKQEAEQLEQLKKRIEEEINEKNKRNEENQRIVQSYLHPEDAVVCGSDSSFTRTEVPDFSSSGLLFPRFPARDQQSLQSSPSCD